MATLMIFSAMLLVAMCSEPLARRARIPFTALLVVIGFIGSELIIMMGIDTGLRWQQFNHLILHVFVPILVFESAYNMNARVLISNLLPVLILAIPAMLLGATISAVILYYAIGYPDAFPLVAALLCGVIISATDPVAVVALFKQLGAPDRLTALLEGESLFNDATAVVMFTLLVSIALLPEAPSLTQSSLDFLYAFLGGILTGLLTGGITSLLYRYFNKAIHFAVISIITATFTFYLAEYLLQVSGIVAVLCAGLLLGERQRTINPDKFTGELWELNAYICNALLFLLVGVTITIGMFTSHWLAMLLGILAATIARAINIYLLFPVITKILPGTSLPAGYKPVMMWGGLRGAVSLALALSIPVQIDSWYSIQSIVYGVVIFTLFFQAPFMTSLVRKSL